MLEVDPMNPNEPILEHLGMTGEEYRKKCRDAMVRNAIKNFYDEHPDLPPTFLEVDFDEEALKKSYEIFNRMYIEPMKIQLAEQAKQYFKDHPDVPACHQLQAAFDRLAPETQSTDEEEIIWPI